MIYPSHLFLFSLDLYCSYPSIIPGRAQFFWVFSFVGLLCLHDTNTKIFLLEFSLAVFPHCSLSHTHLGSEHSFLLISCILQLDLIQMFLEVKENVTCRNFSSTFFFFFSLVLPAWNVYFVKFLFKKFIEFWAWIVKWNYMHYV